MQREVIAWRQNWPLDQSRPLLALRARQMSEALLRVAGLGGVPSSPNRGPTAPEQIIKA